MALQLIVVRFSLTQKDILQKIDNKHAYVHLDLSAITPLNMLR